MEFFRMNIFHVSSHFSRLWIMAFVFLFCLLIKQSIEQQLDVPSSSSNKIENYVNGEHDIPFSALFDNLKEKVNPKEEEHNISNENQMDEQNGNDESTYKEKQGRIKLSQSATNHDLLSKEYNIWNESEYINPNEKNLIEKIKEETNCTNSSQVEEFIDRQNEVLFSKLYKLQNKSANEDIHTVSNTEENTESNNQHNFAREQYEIPFSTLLKAQSVSKEEPESTSNSRIYEIPFSTLFNNQHRKDDPIPRKTEYNILNEKSQTSTNKGLYEIPFSVLFGIQQQNKRKYSTLKTEKSVSDEEQIQVHDRKPYDDSNQINFKYNPDEIDSRDSYIENDHTPQFIYDPIDGGDKQPEYIDGFDYIPQLTQHGLKINTISQPVGDYATIHDTSTSNPETNHQKEMLSPDDKKHHQPTTYIGQLNRIVAILQSGFNENSTDGESNNRQLSQKLINLVNSTEPTPSAVMDPSFQYPEESSINEIRASNLEPPKIALNDIVVPSYIYRNSETSLKLPDQQIFDYFYGNKNRLPEFINADRDYRQQYLFPSSSSLISQNYLKPPNENFPIDDISYPYDSIKSNVIPYIPPVLYMGEESYQSFPFRKIADVTFGRNSSYLPYILEAILESKRPRSAVFDGNVLVSRLSSIFLAKKLEYSVLNHYEVFVQLLLELFIATLEIMKHSESSCINHALKFRGSERYVDGMREILYLRELFHPKAENIGHFWKIN